MGDAFACHAVSNPDQQSEMALLRQYSPNLPQRLLEMLTGAFKDLRALTDSGKLTYPYSTRELVNVIKHLTAYPNDSVSAVLENVFAFDAYDPQLRTMLFGVFRKYGIPLGMDADASQLQGGDRTKSALAKRRALPPPNEVGRYGLEKNKTSGSKLMNISRHNTLPQTTRRRLDRLLRHSKCSGNIDGSHGVSIEYSKSEPYFFHMNKNTITYRGMSMEDAEASGGIGMDMTEGEQGAEWTELEWHSSRSDRFTEEEMWYRIGCVTREGVLIEGTDPMRGSWLGEMIGMQSSQGCVCVLSTMMVMYIADTTQKKARTIPIAVGPGGLENRAQYARGRHHALLRADNSDDSPVVVYDHHNAALLRLWPRDGRMDAIFVERPKGQQNQHGKAPRRGDDVMCAGTLSNMPIAIYFAEHGNEIVLVSLVGEQHASNRSTIRINLHQKLSMPAENVGIISIAPFSPTQMMLQLDNGDTIELSFQIKRSEIYAEINVMNVNAFLQSLTKAKVSLRKIIVASSHNYEEIATPTTPTTLHLLSSNPMPGVALSSNDANRSFNVHVSGGAHDLYGAFTVGVDRQMANEKNISFPAPIMGFTRKKSMKEGIGEMFLANQDLDGLENNKVMETTGEMEETQEIAVLQRREEQEEVRMTPEEEEKQYEKEEAEYHLARKNANLPPRKYKQRTKKKKKKKDIKLNEKQANIGAEVAGVPLPTPTTERGPNGKLYEVVRVQDWQGSVVEKKFEIHERDDDEIHSLSFWHSASKSIVNCIADVGSEWQAPARDGKSTIREKASKLNVAHGLVLLEIVDVLNSTIRRIGLSKIPGAGVTTTEGKGTGGDLTGRNMLVTDAQKTRDAAMNVSKLGMPCCVGTCEVDDGKLVCLFADGHVRVLELREDKLSVEEALYRGLVGGEFGNGGEMSMDDLNLANMEDMEDGDGDDDDEWDEEDYDDEWDNEGNDDDEGTNRRMGGRGQGNQRGGRGRGKGRGNQRGNGTGKGRGKGRGGKGSRIGKRRPNETSKERDARLAAEEAASGVLRAARELVQKAKSSRPNLAMSEGDETVYDELYATVENEITQLRVVLQAVEAKEKERVWLHGKTSGEMDDTRLVDLAIGEKNVYKKRGQKEESRLVQRLPKRLSFVVDVSGSMAYFNRYVYICLLL